MEKKFTEKDVEHIVKITMEASINGLREWFKNETDIVDKISKEKIPNAIIDIRPDTKTLMETYVYPKLVKHGIHINPNKELLN